MLIALEPFGATKSHIECRIGKAVDQILADELVQLQTIYTSIRDNISSPSDWFGVPSRNEEPPAINNINQALNVKADLI